MKGRERENWKVGGGMCSSRDSIKKFLVFFRFFFFTIYSTSVAIVTTVCERFNFPKIRFRDFGMPFRIGICKSNTMISFEIDKIPGLKKKLSLN